jgi:hypothetical protein
VGRRDAVGSLLLLTWRPSSATKEALLLGILGLLAAALVILAVYTLL